jgi:PilZ domain
LDDERDRRSDIARRAATRIERRVPTSLALEDGTRIDCAVNDVSETGAGVASLTAVMPGTTLAIELPGIGDVPSSVAWVSGVRIGIAFDTPIDPDRIVVAPKAAEAPIDRRGKPERA